MADDVYVSERCVLTTGNDGSGIIWHPGFPVPTELVHLVPKNLRIVEEQAKPASTTPTRHKRRTKPDAEA